MEDDPQEPAWDADDPRRKLDCFAPPTEPCECCCLHCGREFSSEGIWFQRVINGEPGDVEGFWMCPTNNCGGAGFTFDIFPIDPDHPANAGWHSFEDEDDEESDNEDWVDDNELENEVDGDEPTDPALQSAIGQDQQIFPSTKDDSSEDPIEPGDEWKVGYAPDEPAPPSIYGDAVMRADQAKYDAPDRRLRVIDRSNELRQ